MQKKYWLGGICAVVILAALFWFGDKKADTGTENTLTAATRFDHAHGMALDPVDSSKLYIATHDGLYVLQSDSNLFLIGNSRDDFMGFTAHPVDSNTFFSSGHSAWGGNIGFQKSNDGGVTWEKVSGGLNGPVDFHAMTVSAANPNIVYGFFRGKLQRSMDGGLTWEYTKEVTMPISLSTHPTNENIVYAATQNGVQMSENKGDQWRSMSAELEGGAVSAFVVHPTDEKFALVFSERLGGLAKSTDSGTTWQRISEGFGGDTLLYLSFSKVDPMIVYALTNSNAIYKSTDKGETWSKIR